MSRIPKTVHFIFGMAPDFGGKPWGMTHHCCVMSAIKHIKPDRVLFHYGTEPTGAWWKQTRPHVTPVQAIVPTEIFGNPVPHVAHRTGVLRLRTLIAYGGIYLDADVLVQRSFDDLLECSTVLGREGEHGEYGMADAVILAEKDSPFLKRWLDTYRTFRSKGRDEYWAEHAVAIPAKLAAEHPDEVEVLPYTAFFWPTWTSEHLRWIFESNRPIDNEAAYAHHLWEALAWEYFDGLSPGRARLFDTNFHRWMRPYVEHLPAWYGITPAHIVRTAKRDARRALGHMRRMVSGTKQ